VAKKRRLIWVDDDPRDRFEYEVTSLEDQNWEVTLASTVWGAVKKLSTKSFNVMLLDQMLPFQAHDAPNVWAGCRLLRWIRRAHPPSKAPDLQEYRRLDKIKPHRENQRIAVYIMSAFFDADVELATRRTGRYDSGIIISPKPILFEEIEKFINSPRPHISPIDRRV
jgi:CheY-like chemotaxis protein